MRLPPNLGISRLCGLGKIGTQQSEKSGVAKTPASTVLLNVAPDFSIGGARSICRNPTSFTLMIYRAGLFHWQYLSRAGNWWIMFFRHIGSSRF